MLERGLFGLVILSFLVIILCNFAFAEIRINEIELNPSGEDDGNEWIELYSDELVKLRDWKIESSNGRNMKFSANFEGYYVVATSRNLLTNANNSLRLIDENEEVVDSTKVFGDNSNSDKSWQYCPGEWVFVGSTRNEENNCPAGENENTNIIQNEENEIEEKEIIVLDSKNRKNSIIYKSKKEYIREYAGIGFMIFCMFLVILLILERRRLEIKEEDS